MTGFKDTMADKLGSKKLPPPKRHKRERHKIKSRKDLLNYSTADPKCQERKINMYLDNTTTKIFAFLIAALIVIVFLEFAFLYETSKECKELRRENRKLMQEKNETRRAIDEVIATVKTAQRKKYRVAFEYDMKRNTADPARHVKEGNYDL